MKDEHAPTQAECDQCGAKLSDYPGYTGERCPSAPFGSCDGSMRLLVRASVSSEAPRHGVSCPKVAHIGAGYLHGPDDDRPYDVDGVTYCGRCHGWLGAALPPAAPASAPDTPGTVGDIIERASQLEDELRAHVPTLVRHASVRDVIERHIRAALTAGRAAPASPKRHLSHCPAHPDNAMCICAAPASNKEK